MFEKWTDQRVAAYKRYIEEDDRIIASSERSLVQAKKSVKNAEKLIESHKRRKQEAINELGKRGIILENIMK